MGASRSFHLQAREWISEKMDRRSMTEPLMSTGPPENQRHHPKGSITFHPSAQRPLEDKKRNKSVSARSRKASSIFTWLERQLALSPPLLLVVVPGPSWPRVALEAREKTVVAPKARLISKSSVKLVLRE